MRGFANKLAAVLGRRKVLVIGTWLVIVLAALPFAAKQTEHLSGGGFDVPGSQSKAVSEAVQAKFGSQSDGVSVLLKAAPGATAAQASEAVARVEDQVAEVDGVVLPAAT